RRSRTLAVTCVAERGGATTVSTGLARTMARAGERVILVDANLARPTLAKRFGVGASCDLSTLLSESDIAASSAVVDTAVCDLRVVAAASPSSTNQDLLSAPSLSRRLAELCELADVVVLDAPALTCSETLILATHVDAVICVLDPTQTRLSTTRRAIAELRAVG